MQHGLWTECCPFVQVLYTQKKFALGTCMYFNVNWTVSNVQSDRSFIISHFPFPCCLTDLSIMLLFPGELAWQSWWHAHVQLRNPGEQQSLVSLPGVKEVPHTDVLLGCGNRHCLVETTIQVKLKCETTWSRKWRMNLGEGRPVTGSKS